MSELTVLSALLFQFVPQIARLDTNHWNLLKFTSLDIVEILMCEIFSTAYPAGTIAVAMGKRRLIRRLRGESGVDEAVTCMYLFLCSTMLTLFVLSVVSTAKPTKSGPYAKLPGPDFTRKLN